MQIHHSDSGLAFGLFCSFLLLPPVQTGPSCSITWESTQYTTTNLWDRKWPLLLYRWDNTVTELVFSLQIFQENNFRKKTFFENRSRKTGNGKHCSTPGVAQFNDCRRGNTRGAGPDGAIWDTSGIFSDEGGVVDRYWDDSKTNCQIEVRGRCDEKRVLRQGVDFSCSERSWSAPNHHFWCFLWHLRWFSRVLKVWALLEERRSVKIAALLASLKRCDTVEISSSGISAYNVGKINFLTRCLLKANIERNITNSSATTWRCQSPKNSSS